MKISKLIMNCVLSILICLLTFAFSLSSIRAELVGYWKFDEGSGAVANDFSGMENHGTVNGASWTSNGDCSNALYFNGSSDYVSVPDSDYWNFGSEDFTVDFWIRLDELPGEGGADIGYAVCFQSTGYNDFWQIYFNPNEGLIVEFVCPSATNVAIRQNPSGSWSSISEGGWYTDTWYHVALVRNGNNFTTYRDTEVVATTISSLTLCDYYGEINIGKSYYMGDDLYHVWGTIDEFRIYKQALSEEELRGDMCACAPDGLDTDADGIADVCDECPNDSDNDIDEDTLCGDVDNCPSTPNPNQSDTYPPQGNGIGDACDCESDFNCDGNVDAADVTTFLQDFGRSILCGASSFCRSCTNETPCPADFNPRWPPKIPHLWPLENPPPRAHA